MDDKYQPVQSRLFTPIRTLLVKINGLLRSPVMSDGTIASTVTHHAPNSGGHCCQAIESLAHSAHVIHDQHCCCVEEDDHAGCKCCADSLEHVLLAMELHIACLRGLCKTMTPQ